MPDVTVHIKKDSYDVLETVLEIYNHQHHTLMSEEDYLSWILNNWFANKEKDNGMEKDRRKVRH